MEESKGFTFWQFLGAVIIGGIVFDGLERVVAAAVSGETEDERWSKQTTEVIVLKKEKENKTVSKKS